MKKLLAILLAVLSMLAVAACGAPATTDNDANAVVSDRNLLCLYVDGTDVTDGKTAYADLAQHFTKQTVAGNEFLAATLADLCAYDISTVQAAFVETTDGFVKYYDDLSKLYLLSQEQAEGELTDIVAQDGTASYAVIVNEDGAEYVAGVCNVFMTTEKADFSVSVKVNGNEVGTITLADFMKKTQVGEDKVKTAMYNGSFLYNGGDSKYEGRFLGVDMETMICKLRDSMGLADIPELADCTDIQFSGYVGMGVAAKEIAVNTNYVAAADSDKYFGNVEFFCMYDGMVRNDPIKQTELGLTAFINGTGSKWITYNLTEINFVTE